MFEFVFQATFTSNKREADMAPGGIKSRRKQALAVPPATGVSTRSRSSLKTKEVPRDGPADRSARNCDKGTSPLQAGKSS